jgi:hypothetical protein
VVARHPIEVIAVATADGWEVSTTTDVSERQLSAARSALDAIVRGETLAGDPVPYNLDGEYAEARLAIDPSLNVGFGYSRPRADRQRLIGAVKAMSELVDDLLRSAGAG